MKAEHVDWWVGVVLQKQEKHVQNMSEQNGQQFTVRNSCKFIWDYTKSQEEVNLK